MGKIYKIGRYVSSDMMGDLICDNPHMLHVLNRFGMPLGFGDKTIAEVCQDSGVDVATFMAVTNALISDDELNISVDLESISASSLLSYLRNSHAYYLEYRLPEIRVKLSEAIDAQDPVSVVIMGYYDGYVDEVRRHMKYEEEVVFPYITNIIDNRASSQYNIDIFSSHHDKIESKLSELKSIIIKYCPAQTSYKLSSVLSDIFTCELNLSQHNNIEDYILIPLVRSVENHIKE